MSMKQTKEQFVGISYDELLAENAKLCQQLTDVTESMGRVEERCAKLRELAADMLKAMRHMEESEGMDVMVGYSPWFAPKLHELGVEVGE